MNFNAPLPGERGPWECAKQPYDRKRAKSLAPVADALAEIQADWERRVLDAETNPDAPFAWQRALEVLGVVWGGNWRVRELVSVQRLDNCTLCHAPSPFPDDPVRGLIPQPGVPLPSLYYHNDSGPRNGQFVRADVTYLKQDFSVMQEIDDHGAWPETQRFDYLVRERKLSQAELSRALREAQDPLRRIIPIARRFSMCSES